MQVLLSCQLFFAFVGFASAWVPSAARHAASRVILQSSRGPPPGIGSYVEGDMFEDPLQEIEALGGDPFFLDNDDNDGEKNTNSEGDFLWDGEIDENAHMDLDFD
eukprot:scaffold3079_cov174-Amphora_coffeaeformis.AAC.7